MVICIRIVRFHSLIIIPLVLFFVRQAKCQVPPPPPVQQNGTFQLKVGTDTGGTLQQIPAPPEELNESNQQQKPYQPPHLGESTEFAEVIENGDAENEEYAKDQEPCPYEDEDYEEFYDDSEDDCCCKERTYGKLLLIGAAILLVLGLCGIVCFTRSNSQNCTTCPSVTTCFRYANPEEMDDDKTCVVNFMKATPDLSESDSDDPNIPLPLIYEDMGKICNNAEMFIQRCMTSSVKRTYSEPVKTITSSKTKFRDYIKELAYLKEKQNQECSKHGAVKAFFHEMLKMFRKSQLDDRRKRDSDEKPIKETRVKIEDSTKDLVQTVPKPIKSNKSSKKKERNSSSSISISSLLLKPQYQSKYYKKEYNYDTYKRRKKEPEKEKRFIENHFNGEKVPLVLNPKRPPQTGLKKMELAQEFRDQKVCPQNTEELIRICVNSMRQPFNKNFITLFDQNNMEQFHGLQDIAATMTKKMAIQERIDRILGDSVRQPLEPLPERNYCIPSSSRDVVTPIKAKPSKEALETFDLLVKQIYVMAAKNRNIQGLIDREPGVFPPNRHDLGPGGDKIENIDLDRHCANPNEEDARAKMFIKYQELQGEVERLNKSLRQFADDFLYPDNRKAPMRGISKRSEPQPFRVLRKSKK